MKSVLETLARRARRSPNGIAVTDGMETLSHSDLWFNVVELSARLARLCPRAGTIAFCLENSPRWVVLDLALTKLERPALPLPLFFTDAQRHHALAQTGAVMLITERPPSGEAGFERMSVLGRELFLQQRRSDPVALPEGTAKITFTSGTTGQPKGVCLSQAGLEQVAHSLVEVIGTDYAGVHCAVLPLAILLENVAGLYPTLLAGGRYHVPPPASLGFAKPFAPDFGMLAGALAGNAATSTILVPELLRGLLAALADNGIELPAMELVAVGGAKVSRELLERAQAQGLPVLQGYGLSECASVVALNTPAEHRPDSVGRPLPHVRIEIAPDGEVLVHDAALLGYVGEAPPSPVLATGDIGHFDETGHLHIDGRKSNVLITAFGRNVAPEWIESELLAQAPVGQALVFGDASPALGALIVPAAMTVTDAQLADAIDRLNRSLPDYAHVKHWSKVLPFTPGNGQLTGNGRMRRAAIHEAHSPLMARCLERPGQYVGLFERLVTETAAERAQFQATPQIRDGLVGRISRQTYLDYLAEAYHHVKHTVPLMRLTHERLPADKAWLREALDEYIAEETGHEEWILDDIAAAGGDAAAVRCATPRPATAAMVAHAYDFVRHVNPVGFFGMVFVLEGTSTQLATVGAEALMKTLGLPRSCFRYLLSHGALDLDHIQFLQDLVNRIEDAGDQAAVIRMAKAMFVLFADVFRSIPHVSDESHVA
jgi:acyl-CoA synthetase (AMP-forming)/AMP-acid ligase II/pyrroloquinoline quinone (PQQ) biosynthesis protein C